MRERLITTENGDMLLELKEKCTTAATLLDDTKTSYKKIFRHPFSNPDLLMINKKIALFRTVSQDCASKSVKFFKVDPAKSFDSMDIFAILADTLGIGIPSDIDGALIQPSESIESTILCSFEDLYEAGLYDGKDLRLIGINEEIFIALEEKREGDAQKFLQSNIPLLEYLQTSEIANIEEIENLITKIGSVQPENMALKAVHKDLCLFLINTFVATQRDRISELLQAQRLQTLSELHEKSFDNMPSFEWCFRECT